MAAWRGLLTGACLLAVAACSAGETEPADRSAATAPAEAAAVPVDDTAADADVAPTEPEPPASAPLAAEPSVTEPPDEDPAAARFERESSEVLFDPDVVHTFSIDVAPELLAELDADPTAEEYVEASLSFLGETIGPIGLRYKGSIGAFVFCTDGPNPLQPSGAKTCTKLSMKLKMNWLDKDDTFYGVKKVQLHSQNLDATKMHERLGYWLFREMGVPAPRSTHARVEINGEFVGLFALTEQIDGRFTRDRFDDGTGNLYKEVWPFAADGALREDDEFLDGLKTNEDDDPSAELITAFAAELDAAPPGSELEVIERWIDVDLFVRTMVVDRAIRNDDGPLHWYCFDGCEPHNFYWYENPSTGKLTLIPWDLDNAFDNLGDGATTGAITRVADRFGDVTDDCAVFPFGPLNLPQKSAACDPLIAAISTLTAEFDAARAELVAGPFSAASVDAQLDAWSAQVEEAVADAAAAHDDAPPVDEWRAALAAMIEEIDVARGTDGR